MQIVTEAWEALQNLVSLRKKENDFLEYLVGKFKK
jgi:hypothetical protein